MSALSRRQFLTQSTAASLATLGLSRLLQGARTAPLPASRLIEPYGPLLPDPDGILDLPHHFSYRILSRQGSTMDDGRQLPILPDGMAAFPGPDGKVLLVRNHEVPVTAFRRGPFKTFFAPRGEDLSAYYDPGSERELPSLGGTTTVLYNPETREVEREFLSLGGTDRNCAGGPMPWGSWVTCEEPEDLLTQRGQRHGYCFEVPATAELKLHPAKPLKALGRFRHEAVAYDPQAHILYLTEDRDDGLFYRFIPDEPENLEKGRLQALVVCDRPQADLRNNFDKPHNLQEGEALDVKWMDLDGIDAPRDDLRYRGYDQGAARFARAEGIFYAPGEIYFCATSGGPEKQGQIFRLTPGENGTPDRLTLFLEPRENDLLTNGDNLCIAPWGDLIICEDLISGHLEKTPHLRGVTPEGQIYTLARNARKSGEFAGSCFSPDGLDLFVNLQASGETLAIRGPWFGLDALPSE